MAKTQVRVPGGVPVRLPVADEDDRPAGRLVCADPGPLAGPAHEARGWPLGNAIRGRSPAETVVSAVTTGTSPTPRASSAAGMKNPKPSLTTSTGIPGRAGPPDEEGKPGSWGWAAASARSSSAGRRDQPDLPLHEAPGPGQPGVVLGRPGFPLIGDELRHQRIRDVGLGDGAVVVDEDRDRRLAGRNGGGGAAAASGAKVTTSSARKAAG